MGKEQESLGFLLLFLPLSPGVWYLHCAGAAEAALVLPFCSLIYEAARLQVTFEFVPALHMRNAMQMGVLS